MKTQNPAPNAPTRLDHLNLTVRNYAEAVDWYGKVFGFKPVEAGEQNGLPWGVIRAGEVMLCIYESPQRIHIPRHDVEDRFHRIDHFGIRLTDEQEWVKTVKREKLETFYGSPVHYPYSKSWYVKDPTGQMIEVVFWEKDEIRFG